MAGATRGCFPVRRPVRPRGEVEALEGASCQRSTRVAAAVQRAGRQCPVTPKAGKAAVTTFTGFTPLEDSRIGPTPFLSLAGHCEPNKTHLS